jgi:tRNA(Ile)-lysidine synthetase-like protein
LSGRGIINVLHIIQRLQLLPAGETVVVAVSGGPDSLALLHLLREYQAELDITLHVATLDHGLRADSAEDAEFVRQTATVWGLPVTVGSSDVAELARSRGDGLEAAARQARYRFLAEVAREVGARRVVTAHHAGDQAETVLMHLLRGAGMQGLQGMSSCGPLPYAPELLLVRPLLTSTRAQLEAYCHAHDLQPRQDQTNLEVDYLRNRLRLEVLPYLQQINPQIEHALTRLAEIIAVDHNYLNAELERHTEAHMRFDSERGYIERDAFRELHPALQRRCIYRAVEEIQPDSESGYEHILHAVEVGMHGQIGALAQMPGGVHLRVDYQHLVIERADQPLPLPDEYALLPPAANEVTVLLPGVTVIPGGGWKLHAETGPFDPARHQAQMVIPRDGVVTLRARKPGDRFAPAGMGGHHQKISDWMVNRKIPQHVRDRIPLLAIDGRVAAVIVGQQWTVAAAVHPEGEAQFVINFFVNFS